jgi:UDP-N-acetylglucosamine 2-epimerase (non-hydrolysing)
MTKVLSIFGTRPEAIKMAPVIKELEKYPDRFQSVVCVTAQHRQMLDLILNLFDIVPDFDLDLMQPEQDLFDITTNVLNGLKPVLKEVRPDLVLVHGDTTTTMAASLAAFYAKIPVGHVEAGLRTGNKLAPFPEEVNRRVTSVVADLHFAPTETAKQNLLCEGVPAESIHVTGNTVIDALLMSVNKIKDENLEEQIKKDLVGRFPLLEKVLSHHESITTRLVLVTGHRRENFGEGFENICRALKEIADRYDDVEIIYPVHLNPNVQEPVYRILADHTRIHLVEPLGYLPFVYIMDKSYLIITDSGGVQEEAPSLGKPVLVIRETTERPEALDAGTVRLVGAKASRLVTESIRLLDDSKAYESMARAHNPFGDGNAGVKIIEVLSSWCHSL